MHLRSIILSVSLVATPFLFAASVHAASYTVSPGSSLGSAISQLRGGDTLTIRGGNYTGEIANVPGGSPGNPTVIQVASGETAIIQSSSCSGTNGVVLFDNVGYITLQGPGLIIDGSNCPPNSNGIGVYNGANHIVLQDLEVRNTPAVGIDYYHGPTDIRVSRVVVHDVGQSSSACGNCPTGHYAMYVSGRRNIIENSEFYNTTSWGIHGYAGDGSGTVLEDFIIRNNYIHNTNGVNANPNGAGGLLFWSVDAGGNQIYNNIISNVNNTGAAVYLSRGTGGNAFYNNTITGNQGGGDSVRTTGASGWTIRNNIIYNNSQDSVDMSGNIVADHNFTSNPQFVSPPTDFHLQPSSPAKIASDTGGEVGAYGSGGNPGGSGGGGGVAPPPPGVNCSTVTLASVLPSGFGSPMNFFTNPMEQVLQAYCDPTVSPPLIHAYIPKPASIQYHYTYVLGYQWNIAAKQWVQFTYACNMPLVVNVWCPGTATKQLDNGYFSTPDAYYISYTCSYVNNQWKCGCRDAACATPYWQLQRFKP